jgi:hypothetical protein
VRGGITGKGWVAGQSGNPGGRPAGLARRIREHVSEDELIRWCLDCIEGVLRDGTRTDVADRRWAVNWLGERGWGKPAPLVTVDDEEEKDEAALEAAVDEFRAEVHRLAALQEVNAASEGPPDAGAAPKETVEEEHLA